MSYSIYNNSGIKPPSNSTKRSVITLLMNLVIFPIWLCILLPLSIIGLIYKINFAKKVSRKVEGKKVNTQEDADAVVAKSAREGRKYDTIIYGATGYTGFLAARYLAEQYGNKKSGHNLKWAIAGRDQGRLERKMADLKKIYPDTFSECDIVVADSNDFAALAKMCNSTKVVCSTVGPFTLHGTKLVNACALYGTDYCDITGELPWVRDCTDNYQDMAIKSGARIVSFCGHDCVPWDMIVYEMHKKQQEMGEKLVKASCWDNLKGSASGGTLDTMFTLFDDMIKGTGPKVARDKRPREEQSFYIPPGAQKGNGFKTKNQIVQKFRLRYDKNAQSWVTWFVMADANYKIIERSNCLVGYSNNMVYQESLIHRSFQSCCIFYNALLCFTSLIFVEPIRLLALKLGAVPKPGEGMKEEDLETGFLNLFGEGTNENGGKVNCVMSFHKDVGYKETARMLIECGNCFVYNNDKVQKTGGMWTTASCFGSTLTKRLCDTGTTFKFYDREPSIKVAEVNPNNEM